MITSVSRILIIIKLPIIGFPILHTRVVSSFVICSSSLVFYQDTVDPKMQPCQENHGKDMPRGRDGFHNLGRLPTQVIRVDDHPGARRIYLFRVPGNRTRT